MAYVSQERKRHLAPAIKAILKKYNLKGTLSVRNHSTLVLNIKSGPLDFIRNANEVRAKMDERRGDTDVFSGFRYDTDIDVNIYHIKTSFTGRCRDALLEIRDAMNEGNFDHSDSQTDYFHVGWYTDIHIGRWNKPYRLEA